MNYLHTSTQEENRGLLKVGNNPYEACKDAHALSVITDWDVFKTYDWQRIYDCMMKPAFIFDGRNILDHQKLTEIGFKVIANGKTY